VSFSRTASVAWLGLVVLQGVSFGQQRAEACRVEVTSPKSGDTVANEGEVQGTATLPPGKKLWVFAHRRGLALWWPQGGGPAEVSKEKWDVLVTYGQERDRGSGFEVAAVVLDEKESADMLNTVKRYEERGEYPGVRLPPPARDCPIAKIAVTKR
jgi:hypothetical protein